MKSRIWGPSLKNPPTKEKLALAGGQAAWWWWMVAFTGKVNNLGALATYVTGLRVLASAAKSLLAEVPRYTFWLVLNMCKTLRLC